jgi:hypothetical protein
MNVTVTHGKQQHHRRGQAPCLGHTARRFEMLPAEHMRETGGTHTPCDADVDATVRVSTPRCGCRRYSVGVDATMQVSALQWGVDTAMRAVRASVVAQSWRTGRCALLPGAGVVEGSIQKTSVERRADEQPAFTYPGRPPRPRGVRDSGCGWLPRRCWQPR